MILCREISEIQARENIFVKKTICLILALFTCFGACAAFVGCGADHVFSEEWTADDTHHWHLCTKEGCDEQGDKGEHTWDGGVQTLVPTAETEGEIRYTCTVCGKIRTQSMATIPTTVENTAWADAFLLKDENLVMTVVNGEGTLIVKKRGGIVETHTPQSAVLHKSYYTVESEKYYCYAVVGEQVTKSEVSEQAYVQATTLIGLQVFDYTAFTYDEASKLYKAAQVSASGVTYENVSVAIHDGRISRISFVKREAGKEGDPCVVTVTYGTVPADLVLPQVTE